MEYIEKTASEIQVGDRVPGLWYPSGEERIIVGKKPYYGKYTQWFDLVLVFSPRHGHLHNIEMAASKDQKFLIIPSEV